MRNYHVRSLSEKYGNTSLGAVCRDVRSVFFNVRLAAHVANG